MGPANAQIPISVYLEGWTAVAAILAKSAGSSSVERISSTNVISKQMPSRDAKEKRTEKTARLCKNPTFLPGRFTHCMFKFFWNSFSTLAHYYASMFGFVVLALHAQVVFFQMLSGRVPSEDGSVRGIFQEGADTFLHIFCW